VDHENYISDTDCARLAQTIKEELFIPAASYKTQVFLCGAALNNPRTLRSKIAEDLSSNWYSHQFDLIYPEDIFDELLYNRKSHDLLSLENILVESVDAVVIIPESPGSFAELGAFVNNALLRHKVICVIDEKYRKQKSFIIRGPVRLVREIEKDRVIYVNPNQLENDIRKLRKQLTTLKDNRPKDADLHLLQIERFLLPVIYLLEPISETFLTRIVKAVTRPETAFQLTTAALSVLKKKKYVELAEANYSLTRLGFINFEDLRRRYSSLGDKRLRLLDNLRLAILNWKIRGKKLTI